MPLHENVWLLIYDGGIQFKDNDHVIFDLQNEPNGVAADTTFGMQQAAIYSIRAAGATSQLILVEGTSWTGAWSKYSRSYMSFDHCSRMSSAAWTTSSGNAAAFTGLTDPANNVAVEMHQVSLLHSQLNSNSLLTNNVP
jgi:endoglucanase